MTLVAVLADIHSNMPAFEAVIEDISAQGAEEVILAGDLVGRGPQGREVINRAIELGWPCVRGNHEDYMLGFIHRTVPKNWWHEPVWSASRWMSDNVSEHAAYMAALPLTMTSRAAPPLRIFHGTPRANNEGIGPWTSEDARAAYLDSIEEDVLVCAHTHRAMRAEVDTRQIVNVGSVGLPFNGDWRAQYALFECTAGRWDVAFRQVEYDRESFLRIYETSGFLDQGGITALLLKMEVETARPHLVPFLKWAEVRQRGPEVEALPDFFEEFDPAAPLARFYTRLMADRG